MALARWSLDLASAPAPPVAKARPLIAPPVAEARGLKKHLKSLSAPKHWMLDKLGGAFAPKPSSGPHKSRECLPLILIIRNMLKYALTYCEVISILMQRHVLVDGKVRTDKTYPAGFMDVISIPKTNENYRLLPSSPNQG
uniref:RNA-binding S4 domain-containing protein n=1 Tax=Zea mays TaxID=4577 RepID=A0A804LPW0_MAIZE